MTIEKHVGQVKNSARIVNKVDKLIVNFYLTGVLCANCEKTFSVKESSEDTEYNTMEEYCRIEECRKTAATCS